MRVATWHVELTRRGPGLLLRDILRGDAQVDAVVKTIAEYAPDVLLLTAIDGDHDLNTLGAIADELRAVGQDYPHLFAPRSNRGLATAFDLDGDGYTGGPGDAQGFGRFAGNGGMAILSKLPIDRAAARDFSALLWRDLPGAMLPTVDGAPFPSAEAMLHQRLSSTGHWDVPLVVGTRRIHLLAFAATTPVFDGPDDRNGRRNHDEVAFWARYLDGGLQYTPPLDPVVVLGNANLDPSDGDGLRRAIETLLTHARLQDPAPAAAGGAIAARLQGGANASQTGDPAHDTADWQDQPGPGNLRVSYVLPDMALKVLDAGVVWPVEGDPLYHVLSGENAPRHHMVWVDFDIPD